MSYCPTEPESGSEDLRERTEIYDPVRIKRVQRRYMLTFVPEFAVRTVLDYKEIIFLSQGNQHLPLLQCQGLSGRILEVRNHIEELYLLAFGLYLSDFRFIGLPESIKIFAMAYASYISTVGLE